MTYASLEPYGTGASYVNFLMRDEDVQVRSIYGVVRPAGFDQGALGPGQRVPFQPERGAAGRRARLHGRSRRSRSSSNAGPSSTSSTPSGARSGVGRPVIPPRDAGSPASSPPRAGPPTAAARARRTHPQPPIRRRPVIARWADHRLDTDVADLVPADASDAREADPVGPDLGDQRIGHPAHRRSHSRPGTARRSRTKNPASDITTPPPKNGKSSASARNATAPTAAPTGSHAPRGDRSNRTTSPARLCASVMRVRRTSAGVSRFGAGVARHPAGEAGPDGGAGCLPPRRSAPAPTARSARRSSGTAPAPTTGPRWFTSGSVVRSVSRRGSARPASGRRGSRSTRPM